MAKGFFPKNERDSELDRFRFRIVFAAIAVLLAFAILLTRFSWLQIVRHEYYITRAEDNRISLVPVTPNRGVIVDRNGTVLARNYSAFTLEITPSKVDDLEATIDALGTMTWTNAAEGPVSAATFTSVVVPSLRVSVTVSPSFRFDWVAVCSGITRSLGPRFSIDPCG